MALSVWCVSSWKLREKDVGVSLQLCMCDNGDSHPFKGTVARDVFFWPIHSLLVWKEHIWKFF
jgi:hypothetical protein